MRDRRVNERFDVSASDLVKAKTAKAPSGEKLLTMSAAGCGFCSLLDEFKFKVGDIIELEFEAFGRPSFRIQGAVLYTTPYPMSGEIGRFYGVRFLGDYEKDVSPIISELKSMYETGKIAMAQ